MIGKDSEMLKSSIAKYNSSIDDEEPLININNNNYDISIKNILEKNNYNITNNRTKLSKNNIKNNLYYFSNFPELSKSFNNNNNNISNSNIKPNEESNKKTDVNIRKNCINNINKNLNDSNVGNNNTNENNIHNIIRSLSYVKKNENKIGEIKINFGKGKEFQKKVKNNNEKDNLINSLSGLNISSNLIPRNKNSNLSEINLLFVFL